LFKPQDTTRLEDSVSLEPTGKKFQKKHCHAMLF